MGDPKANIKITADDSGLRASLREMVSRMRDFGGEAKKGAEGANGPLDVLRGHYASLASLLGGGVLAAFVKTHVDLQDELSKAAQKAGVTTEAYSSMAYAAKLADVSGEALTKTYAHLGATLSDAQQGQAKAVELFQRLKLDPKNIRDADELLLQIADRLGAMGEGVRKTGLLVDIFGEKLGPQLAPLLGQGRAGLEQLRKEAEHLGLVVSTEAGRAAEQFNDTLTKIRASSTGAGMKLATELTPILQTVADEFFRIKDGGSGADTVIKGIRTTFEAITVTAANVAFVVKGVGREIGALVAQMRLLQGEGDSTSDKLLLAFAPGAAMLKAITGKGFGAKWTAISDAVKEDGERAKAELEALEKRLMGIREAGGGRGFVNPDEVRTNPFTPGDKPSNAPKAPEGAKSYMGYYEAMLAEERRVQSTLEAGRDYSKEQELAFWRFLVDNLQLTSNDRVAVLRKMNQLEVDIARQGRRERMGVNDADLQTAEKLALGRIDAEAAAGRAAVELNQITKEQLAALEIQWEGDRYRIQSEGLQNRLRLLMLDPDANPAEMARIKGELLVLEQQHQTRRNQLLVDAAKKRASLGDALADSLGGESMWQSTLDSMLLHAQTWGDALRNIFKQVGTVFLQELITKPLAAWIAGMARMLLVKLGFLGQEKAADVAASSAKIGLKGMETDAVVTANATQAGTGAAASQAAIPVVGPGLALAAMAAIFAAVMALGSRKSAAGGYDIPKGVNPVTQLHEEEMVLPSPLANAVRRMTGGPEAPAQAAAPMPPVELRGVSAGDFFIAVRSDLLRVLNGAKRDFAWRG